MDFLSTAAPEGISYVVILLLHAAAALLGLTALVAAGVTASRTASLSDLGAADESVRTYYQPGSNLLGRCIHLVPITGILLVVTSQGAFAFRDVWIGLGLALWCGAAFVAESGVYSAERSIQAALAQLGSVPDWRARAKRIERSSVIASCLIVVAVVVMVVQPG